MQGVRGHARGLQVGVLMRLDSYPTAHLQLVLALLTQAEAAGVTDVRTVRERIAEHVRRQRLAGRVTRARARLESPGPPRCPACGRPGYMEMPVNVSACTNVGGPWRAVRLCRACGHEEWLR